MCLTEQDKIFSGREKNITRVYHVKKEQIQYHSSEAKRSSHASTSLSIRYPTRNTSRHRLQNKRSLTRHNTALPNGQNDNIIIGPPPTSPPKTNMKHKLQEHPPSQTMPLYVAPNLPTNNPPLTKKKRSTDRITEKILWGVPSKTRFRR